MLTGITFTLVLNRDFDASTDYISVGRCSLEFLSRDFGHFDFYRTSGEILENHKVYIEADELHCDLSRGALSPEDFLSLAEEAQWESCFTVCIDLGDYDDSPGLEILGIEDFKVYFTEYLGGSNFKDDIVEVPSESITLLMI